MINAFTAWGVASGIRDVENPDYTVEDFRQAMPAFKAEIISDEILNGFIELANNVVSYGRWGNLWKEGMRLVVAHYATLYLQQPQEEASVDEIVNAGKIQGSISSKSVGGVSVSFDNSTAISDLNGWGLWKLTVYGAQFAQLAKMVGKGGMYIP